MQPGVKVAPVSSPFVEHALAEFLIFTTSPPRGGRLRGRACRAGGEAATFRARAPRRSLARSESAILTNLPRKLVPGVRFLKDQNAAVARKRRTRAVILSEPNCSIGGSRAGGLKLLTRFKLGREGERGGTTERNSACATFPYGVACPSTFLRARLLLVERCDRHTPRRYISFLHARDGIKFPSLFSSRTSASL